MVKLVQFNLKIDWWYSMAQKFITNFLLKTKSAPTEADAQKTQTPIDSRQTNQYKASLHLYRRNLHFYQIHGMNAKGYNTPHRNASLFD